MIPDIRSRQVSLPTTPAPAHSRSMLPVINLQMRRKSTPVRFPDPRDEDQLLLPVETFPEEHLANNQDPVLTDFLRIEPKVKPSARPRSLKESFRRIGEGLQKPRIHLPRQRVSNDGSSLGRIQQTFQEPQQFREISADQPTKPKSIVTLKPI